MDECSQCQSERCDVCVHQLIWCCCDFNKRIAEVAKTEAKLAAAQGEIERLKALAESNDEMFEKFIAGLSKSAAESLALRKALEGARVSLINHGICSAGCWTENPGTPRFECDCGFISALQAIDSALGKSGGEGV